MRRLMSSAANWRPLGRLATTLFARRLRESNVFRSKVDAGDGYPARSATTGARIVLNVENNCR
jgi:hypothetical protein